MAQQTDTRRDVTGNWKVAGDWALGVTPGSVSLSDPALFHGATTNYTTTVTDTESAGAVTLNDAYATLTIATGGQLLVGSRTSTDLNLDAGTLDLAGMIGAGNGSALVITEAGATTNYDGGTLSDAVIDGTLDLSATNATVVSAGGLVVSNPTSGDQGQINVTGSGANLTFASTTTLANVALDIGGTTNATVTLDAGTTLTLDNASAIELINTQATINGAGTLVLDGSTGLESQGVSNGVETPAQTLVLATAAVQNNGTITLGGGCNAGTLVVSGVLTGTGSIVVNQLDDYADTIEFGSTVASTQTIDVTNGQGSVTTLRLDGVTAATPNAVAGKITGLGGFGTNDVIDLIKVTYSTALTEGVVNGALTIKSGSTVEAVLNTDLASGTGIFLTPDGSGGTDVVIRCYCIGTLIRTVRGDVALEHLAVGDLVVTVSGARRPIRWIGYRETDCRRHSHPRDAMPVRIQTDAFGPGAP